MGIVFDIKNIEEAKRIKGQEYDTSINYVDVANSWGGGKSKQV